MFTCPTCEADLERWQIECHHCGQAVSSDAIPIIASQEVSKKEIQKAFKDWMDRGKSLLKRKSYDEAHACFAEALTRVSGLKSQRLNEIKARKSLARAFEKLNKKNEAVEQLVIAVNLSNSKNEKESLQKRIDRLNSGREQEFEKGKDKELGPPDANERISSLLFCVSCSRLMTESEVYQFRAGRSDSATCLCGFKGIPLVHKSDHLNMTDIISSGLKTQSRKERLIEAAQKPLAGGRTQSKAFWLALLLGTFGAHKFYLGDKARGFIYLLLAWTLIPLIVSIYEAILIAQMSRVSFNLAYNIEGILDRVPLESLDEPIKNEEEIISMEITDDPEDVVDEWSSADEV